MYFVIIIITFILERGCLADIKICLKIDIAVVFTHWVTAVFVSLDKLRGAFPSPYKATLIQVQPLSCSHTYTQYTHLRPLSGHEKHSSSGINKILIGRCLAVRAIQLGDGVVDINDVQRSPHTLNHTGDSRAFFCSL